MKKRVLTLAAVMLCAALLLPTAGLETARAADVITLKIANFFPPPSKQSQITEAFGKELESRSGGRIKVNYFAGGSLLKPDAMYKGIESGITDIGYSHVYYTPGRMPMMEGAGLPLGTPSGWVGAHVAYDVFNKFKPKEFDGVKVLCIHGNAPSLLITKTPVRKLDDLKGLNIRAPGVPGEIIKALGGTPTPTPMPEVYDSISKGVNQGVWAPYETLRTFRFAEVAKYVTVCWQIGAPFPFYLAMNKSSFEKLPPDLQALVDTMSGEYQERYALMWNEIDMAGRSFGKAQGVEFIELSDEQSAAWQAKMEPVIADYTKRMVEKGFAEDEVKGWVTYMKERIQYWTEKQMEFRIPSPTGPAGMRPEAYVN